MEPRTQDALVDATAAGAPACGESAGIRCDARPCARARSWQGPIQVAQGLLPAALRNPVDPRPLRLFRVPGTVHLCGMRYWLSGVEEAPAQGQAPFEGVTGRTRRLGQEMALAHRRLQFVAKCRMDRHSSLAAFSAFSARCRAERRTYGSARRSCPVPGRPWSPPDRPPQGADLGRQAQPRPIQHRIASAAPDARRPRWRRRDPRGPS